MWIGTVLQWIWQERLIERDRAAASEGREQSAILT